jgi:transposase
MAFAQLTYRESLRDIETCLRAIEPKLYHAAFRGNIPCFVRITHGKVHDVTALDHLILEPSSFYIMDRGYVDFVRLYRFTQSSAFFVTRSKKNLDFSRRSNQTVDKTTGLRSDQTIVLNGPKTSKAYPAPPRRVSYSDPETARRLVFLTNNLQLPALTIAKIYKCRWQVELFFKWIKQHLRIKAFYGNSSNAVKTQVWIAINVYVLLAIVKKELNLERSPSEILQILSITLFEKTPIFEALAPQKTGSGEEPRCNSNVSGFRTIELVLQEEHAMRDDRGVR